MNAVRINIYYDHKQLGKQLLKHCTFGGLSHKPESLQNADDICNK